MKMRQLGGLWPVSALSLGGAGIGGQWGETSYEEGIATIRAAVDAGITLLDLAPTYGARPGDGERLIGAAFGGRLPAGIRVTTKHRLGSPPPQEVEKRLRTSLDDSLARMRLERVDLFFLHSNIIADDYDASAYRDRPPTRWTTYVEGFVPACEKLVAEGRIGAWGITGIGIPGCILAAFDRIPRPAAVQCIANLLDSAGELQYFEGPSRAREIIAAGRAAGVGVMGIRPVQGGALTDTVDRDLPAGHGVVADYARAAAFRALARELGTTPAALAHRYALSMEGIDTVVLGCKNRAELAECVAAAEAGPLEAEIVARIDAAADRP